MGSCISAERYLTQMNFSMCSENKGVKREMRTEGYKMNCLPERKSKAGGVLLRQNPNWSGATQAQRVSSHHHSTRDAHFVRADCIGSQGFDAAKPHRLLIAAQQSRRLA